MPTEDTNESIGQRIARLLHESGMSQSELADRIGLTKAAISQWVGDAVPNIRPHNLFALADALNTTPKYIVFGTPEGLSRDELNRAAEALRHAAASADLQAQDPKYSPVREVLLSGARSDRALSEKCTRLALAQEG